MLQFCPVCKRLLMIKEEGGKNIGVCSCGFKRMNGMEIIGSEKIKSDKIKVSVEVIKDEKMSGFEYTCVKCGHNYCDIRELGEILNNESRVVLYICRNCKHVHRETK